MLIVNLPQGRGSQETTVTVTRLFRKMKLKYKIVLEGEYEVYPSDYDTDDINAMAEMDRELATNDLINFLEETGLDYSIPKEVIILPA